MSIELAKSIYKELRVAADAFYMPEPSAKLTQFYAGEVLYKDSRTMYSVELEQARGEVGTFFRGLGFLDEHLPSGVFRIVEHRDVDFIEETAVWKPFSGVIAREVFVSLSQKRAYDTKHKREVPLTDSLIDPIARISRLSLIPETIVHTWGDFFSFAHDVQASDWSGIVQVDANWNTLYASGITAFCTALQSVGKIETMRPGHHTIITARLPQAPEHIKTIHDLVRQLTRSDN